MLSLLSNSDLFESNSNQFVLYVGLSRTVFFVLWVQVVYAHEKTATIILTKRYQLLRVQLNWTKATL